MGQVINVKKLKFSKDIKKISAHNLRDQIADNVDPDKSKNNLYLVGTPGMNINQILRERLKEVKHRKDANKIVNLVFSGSNEEMSKIDVEKWSKEITQYCQEKFGKENILYSVLHRDEKTPHLHISFIPLVDNKLRSNIWFDKPDKLSQFRQEVYKKINNKYGFRKDIPVERTRVKANHETVQEYYDLLNQAKSYDNQIDKEFNNLLSAPEPKKNQSFTDKLKNQIKNSIPVYSAEKLKQSLSFTKLFMKRALAVNYQNKQAKKKLEDYKKKLAASEERSKLLEKENTQKSMILERLGADKLDIKTALNNTDLVNGIKHQIESSLTAKAEKGAYAPLKKENEVLKTSSTSIYQMPKPKPR